MNILNGLIPGLMGPNPAQKQAPKPQAESPEPAVAAKAVIENSDRSPEAVAMSVANPETPAQQAVETKVNEKQSLLMKAVEGLAKTFGFKMADLTKLLLKANPAVAQEAIADAMKSMVKQQQAPAETAAVPA